MSGLQEVLSEIRRRRVLCRENNVAPGTANEDAIYRICEEIVSNALAERTRALSQLEGWALVPINPTQEMLDEACSSDPHPIIAYTEPHERDGSVPLIPIATWRAMLAARPEAPALASPSPAPEAEPVGFTNASSLRKLKDASRWHEAVLAPSGTGSFDIPLYTTPTPAPEAEPVGTMTCPCCTFEQDEDCVVGYPSLLCTACGGKGIAPVETVVAFAAEMMKIAEQVGELADPFAAWETISLLQSQYTPTPAVDADAVIEALNDKIDGLEADLQSAVEVAFRRGATEWVRLNYPDRFSALSLPPSADKGE